MFSGGDYEEVARWLANFVTSHAKRESPRVEAIVEAGHRPWSSTSRMFPRIAGTWRGATRSPAGCANWRAGSSPRSVRSVAPRDPPRATPA